MCIRDRAPPATLKAAGEAGSLGKLTECVGTMFNVHVSMYSTKTCILHVGFGVLDTPARSNLVAKWDQGCMKIALSDHLYQKMINTCLLVDTPILICYSKSRSSVDTKASLPTSAWNMRPPSEFQSCSLAITCNQCGFTSWIGRKVQALFQ